MCLFGRDIGPPPDKAKAVTVWQPLATHKLDCTGAFVACWSAVKTCVGYGFGKEPSQVMKGLKSVHLQSSSRSRHIVHIGNAGWHSHSRAADVSSHSLCRIKASMHCSSIRSTCSGRRVLQLPLRCRRQLTLRPAQQRSSSRPWSSAHSQHSWCTQRLQWCLKGDQRFWRLRPASGL